ncbi:PepSY-associated TM helix domain-containing protein [Paraflavitalea pollutisoli]|uniref:PepSY-associated TM helix domain-containing protein n=1 Tax=Paraflavitalea pollutisoli TaxID=3034143 RepID=UPI0023EB509E|nr:PepSY-associated TM helix domain-containing protein [Paraflavitalea sp. H1-2-19X]
MTKKRKSLQWARHQQRWFGKWHLYLGIIAGLIVAIVGVTGSILVFQDEIDRALNKELFVVMEQQHKIPVEKIVPMVRQQYPHLQIDYIMALDTNANAAYQAFNFKTEEEFFINPYTGALSGKRIHESSFVHIVTEIHRTLLIPAAGRYIVGISTLILLILTITGLRLWIPQKWKLLKSVLTVNFKTSFKRQNYDWHNVLGFYSAPVVALLSLTGVCITFSLLVVPLLFLLSGRSPQGVAQVLGAKSEYTPGATPLSLDSVVAIGKRAMPENRVGGLALPTDSSSNYRLDLVSPGLPKSGKREMLIIDQYTGKVLLNSRTDFPNVGNGYLSWVTPIHYGSFGGRPTQIVALLAGLMPLVLFITGFIIWWPRYKKQRKSDSKKAQRAAQQAAAGDQPMVGEPSAAAPAAVPNATVGAMLQSIPVRQYFWIHLKKGVVYASWFVLIGAVMGALYGVFSGIVIEPAVFTVVFTAIFVTANFVVALISLLFYTLFLLPFKRNGRPVLKYFALSLSFFLVFLVAYSLLMNTGMKIF